MKQHEKKTLKKLSSHYPKIELLFHSIDKCCSIPRRSFIQYCIMLIEFIPNKTKTTQTQFNKTKFTVCCMKQKLFYPKKNST